MLKFRLQRQMARFGQDRSGQFAIMFTLFMGFVMGAVGLAVDLTEHMRIKGKLQNAADAAALVAAKEKDKTDAERKKLAEDFLRANLNDVSISTLAITIGKSSATVDVTANTQNYIMSAFGKNASSIAASSTAQENATTLELVFALDVSGSMQAPMSSGNTRIQELKIAVNALVDRLKAETSFDIRAAIVPFTMTVNVGMNNTSFVSNRTNILFSGTEWKGCVFERPAPDHIRDNPPGNWSAYIWPPMPNQVNSGDSDFMSKSNGAMTGYGSLDETTASDKSAWYNGPNYNCVRYPIVPLTGDLAALKTEVNNLRAYSNMGTLIAPAVTWGMRVLSPAQPFNEGLAYGPQVHKILMVVTDGDQVTEAEFTGDGVANQSVNTTSPWTFNPADFGLGGAAINTGFGPADNLSPYGFIRDSRPFGGVNTEAKTQWNQHMDELVDLSDAACDEAKRTVGGRKIEIITLGVSDATAPGTRAYTALHNCASAPEDHFYVRNKSDLDAAFDRILTKLSKLRVAS